MLFAVDIVIESANVELRNLPVGRTLSVQFRRVVNKRCFLDLVVANFLVYRANYIQGFWNNFPSNTFKPFQIPNNSGNSG